MPAAKSNTGATASTGTAQGRFTVQLPGALGPRLDAIGKAMSDAVFESAKARIELSRPQVIESLVATYEAVTADAATDPDPDPADTGDAPTGD